MGQQIINVGTEANDRTGDPLRTAFQKCNLNFTELYTAVADGATLGDDLTALEALTDTGLFYRSAAGVWTKVTIGANLLFSGGTLSATGEVSGSVAWADVTGTPTTLAGYGITDAAASSHTHAFSTLTSKPTTLAGYGITDAAASSHTHTIANITGLQDELDDRALSTHTHAFASLTSTPTTLAGYGITDGVTDTELSLFNGSGNINWVGTITTGIWNGGIIPPDYLGTGTSIATKFLRGDGTWQTVSGGGGGTWGSITGTLSDQTDLQTALNAKAPLASPTFTGTPAAPTAATSTNTTQIATTAFVQQEIASSVGGTPVTLDDPGTDSYVIWNDTTNEPDVITYAAQETARGYVRLTASQTLTNKTLAYGSNTITGLPVELLIKCSDETTAITAGTAKVTFRMPFAMTLSAVRAAVNTAPTGSTLVIDINETGTTILSTKLSIDASEKTSTTAATAAVISDTALADDAEITIDFDQVGSTIAGAGVSVALIGTRT